MARCSRLGRAGTSPASWERIRPPSGWPPCQPGKPPALSRSTRTRHSSRFGRWPGRGVFGKRAVMALPAVGAGPGSARCGRWQRRARPWGDTTEEVTPMTNAIEATGLVKRFGKTTALAGVDLVARPGTVLGVLGPNGAGKTTAVRILATLLKADDGQAQVCGYDVARQAHQ